MDSSEVELYRTMCSLDRIYRLLSIMEILDADKKNYDLNEAVVRDTVSKMEEDVNRIDKFLLLYPDAINKDEWLSFRRMISNIIKNAKIEIVTKGKMGLWG